MKTAADRLPSSPRYSTTSHLPSRSHTCQWERRGCRHIPAGLQLSWFWRHQRANTQSRHKGKGLPSVFVCHELFRHRISTALETRVAGTFLQEKSCRKATSLPNENTEPSDCQVFQHQFWPSQREFASVKFVVQYCAPSYSGREKSHCFS